MSNGLWVRVLMVLVVCMGWAQSGPAVCVYNREANAIWIYDYSSEVPARPRQLLFANQVNGWDLVTYDPTNDAYTINANLWIGRNNGSDTYFQLGAPDHTNETLILKGNLVIYPTYIKGENKLGEPQGVHRLTIGCPDRADVCARLLFHNEPDCRYTLYAGAYYRGSPQSPLVRKSGQLHVYHGLISAVDPRYPFRSHFYMYLSDVVFKHATLSRVAGTILYGSDITPYDTCRIEDSVFEQAGNAVAWGHYEMRGVTFRNLGMAFKSSSNPLAVTLTECRFEDNDANWSLAAPSKIYLVDCAINPPRRGNRYAARADAKSASAIQVVSSRHVRVKVTDARGKLMENVRVEVRGEQDDRMRRAAVTDAEGLTPRAGVEGTLLLDEWEEQAGPRENEPVRREFSYTIAVSLPPGDAIVKCRGVKPTVSGSVIEIVL